MTAVRAWKCLLSVAPARLGGTLIRGIRKHFFTERVTRVVAPWNSLPADTDFSSLNRFKRCINAVDLLTV